MQNSAGVTESERYLTRLCGKVFLSLWSYPNLYRDQGNGGKGDGKELCDLLVVFGRDVLIFSDKHCRLRMAGDEKISWGRWYRDAVLNLRSAKQVAGAERWLLQQPKRVFTDPACTIPLPIDLPAEPIFHRIVTCRGAAEASRSTWGGTGSLFVTNHDLVACAEDPFRLGSFDERRRMVHVFDEVALDSVLGTLDTVSDFVRYLTKKETFYRKYDSVSVAGEEELVGRYLMSQAPEGGHDFVLPIEETGSKPTHIVLDESSWDWWQKSKQRQAKAEADKASYRWDGLIEKFSFHMLAGTQQFPDQGDARNQERIVRWMAREHRFRRRILAAALIDTMKNTPVGQMRKKYIPPHEDGDPAWVFLMFPREDGVDYNEYRRLRQRLLIGHCWVIKYLFPDTKDIAGIAAGPHDQDLSEDGLCMDVRDWNDDLNERVRRLHEEGGFFKAPLKAVGREWEFPIDNGPRSPSPNTGRSKAKEQRHKRQAAKKARRKNRS